jgi:hypothetical protein
MYGLFFGNGSPSSRRSMSGIKHSTRPSSAHKQQLQQQQHIRSSYEALFSHTSSAREVSASGAAGDFNVYRPVFE